MDLPMAQPHVIIRTRRRRMMSFCMEALGIGLFISYIAGGIVLSWRLIADWGPFTVYFGEWLSGLMPMVGIAMNLSDKLYFSWLGQLLTVDNENNWIGNLWVVEVLFGAVVLVASIFYCGISHVRGNLPLLPHLPIAGAAFLLVAVLWAIVVVMRIKIAAEEKKK